MTVPSIPIVSEVARSMPSPSPVAPRQMFPPPIMMASSSPSASRAAAISDASRSTVGASIVSSLDDDASASPDILRTQPATAATQPADRRPGRSATIVAAPSSWAIVCFSSFT